MAVTIALLQGVNVGKYKRISMADLKAIIADLGGEEATTVANSGNVVFRQDDSLSPKDLRLAIEKAVSKHVGVEIPTITRSAEEMREVVAKNPYPEVEDPKCLHVDFLLQAMDSALDGIEFGNDDLTLIGRDLYMYLPKKMSGITYDAKSLHKRLGTHHTSRNWSTITKLVDLSNRLESSSPK